MSASKKNQNSKISTKENSPRSSSKLFFYAQIAALIGTAVDFILVIFLTELVGIWYVVSNAIGATCGAIVNFSLGRNWVFLSKKNKVTKQAFRYFLVATGSMILNTLGVFLLTELSSLHYIYSKVIIAIIIAFTFNFFLQKSFVFQK